MDNELLLKCCEFAARHFLYPHSINVARHQCFDSFDNAGKKVLSEKALKVQYKIARERLKALGLHYVKKHQQYESTVRCFLQVASQGDQKLYLLLLPGGSLL
ncbi:hypothetical protein BCR41DRAFT_359479 [Lobosporangium transversale]|uniref:Uncharacterized protein n=1 Tax=Lobosporangium transversale TaxID=64571 RepID=A0A1Y2GDZ4_9FUNG|nr:hypothetical protein BCR41DRAFT_359479 [Lobosporangium transversale]ORZ08234.1 hypothetical protein BCR41DRAFT_359479 [Lobosporangium transversale]|eukprot:XP_021878317.1 hypothetical protein BCR41DRAFT_359479 [Lobosporangium transversale]